MLLFRILFILTICCTLYSSQNTYTAQASSETLEQTPAENFLLTIFLKHDQSKSLNQIQEELRASGFWGKFPPEGIEIKSWYVMMGIGQVVTLSVPPNRLREVNRVVEQTAWGSFRTEFYATYDLADVANDFRKNALSTQRE